MIEIITRSNSVLTKEYWKYIARNLLKKKRGPEAVVQSLSRGLNYYGEIFSINRKAKNSTTHIHVISGIKALAEAIQRKKRHPHIKLIAGPNIMIDPLDHDKILCDESIDAILLPSEWTKRYYATKVPALSHKIHVWPSGTEIPDIGSSEQHKPDTSKTTVLFIKEVPAPIVDHVKKVLDTKKMPYTVLTYGSFKRDAYLELLTHAGSMIYLQQVESQGIALQEAWSYGVPTLVWSPGSFTYPDGTTIVDRQISCPYLTPESGHVFTSLSDFEQELATFCNTSFNPKMYCMHNLSDTVTTKHYLDILTKC